jgi:hypothetical protein
MKRILELVGQKGEDQCQTSILPTALGVIRRKIIEAIKPRTMPYRPETNGLLTIEVKSPGCGTTMSGKIPVKIISPNRVPQNKPVSRTNDRLNLPVMPIAKPVNVERINVGPSKTRRSIRGRNEPATRSVVKTSRVLIAVRTTPTR